MERDRQTAGDGRGAAWHLEAEFGASRGIVRMVEGHGGFAIAVRLDCDGRDPVAFTVTPDQAAWLGDALPAALAMSRSWQEQRDWEMSRHDPFADFDRADQERAEAGEPAPAAPASGTGTDRMTNRPDRSVDDVPLPKRRGQAWSKSEEAQLVAAHREGQGVEQLAVLLQRSPRAIAKRLERLGLVVDAG